MASELGCCVSDAAMAAPANSAAAADVTLNTVTAKRQGICLETKVLMVERFSHYRIPTFHVRNAGPRQKSTRNPTRAGSGIISPTAAMPAMVNGTTRRWGHKILSEVKTFG